jgi:hypothetical protein
MADVWSSVGVFALGGVGWWVASFIGRPFREFFDLRRDVIHKCVLYANVMALEKESIDGSVEPVERTEYEIERLHEAQNAFRDLAARMRAFALNEMPAVWLVKKWGYDPMNASIALMGLEGTLHKYGRARHDAKETLEKILRFRTTA